MPAFAFRHVKELYPVFWSKSREMVERLKEASNSSVPTSETKNAPGQDPEKSAADATVHAPGAVHHVAEGRGRPQSGMPNVAWTPEASQVQEETIDIFAQPVASPLPEMPSPPSPVVLPEISLPAFFLQSAVEPKRDGGRPVMPVLGVRQPCPTCGCSSREHQNV